MAFFTTAQNLQICLYCKIALSQIPQLVARESYAYYTLELGDPLVDEVQKILTELDTLETQLASYGSDKNALLTRADTLEWSIEGGGFVGMTTQRKAQIIDRLVGLLSIGELAGSADTSNGSSGGCGTMLLRS